MPKWLVSNPGNEHDAVQVMRRRLDEFYGTTSSYPVFQSSPDHSAFYRTLSPILDEIIKRRSKARVLELGAGRPTFPVWLGDRRSAVEYSAHDVTAQNRAYLESIADHVLIGDISSIQGEYDLVFSTFAFEHVSAPSPFLEHVRRLLAPRGTHVIICPRYDQPGYLCPSLRHHSFMGRAGLMLFFGASRCAAAIDGRPRFWVNTEPAVFSRPFFRDADAVHIVSRPDVERWHRANGFDVKRLSPVPVTWRQWIAFRLLTLSIACTKRG